MFRWKKKLSLHGFFRCDSLVSRIISLSFLSVLVALIIAGSSIFWAFNRSVERSLATHLSAYVDMFIAATQLDSTGKVTFHEGKGIFARLPRYWQVEIGEEKLAKSPLLVEWMNISDNRSPLQYVTQGEDILAVSVRTLRFPGNQDVTYIMGMQADIADAFMDQEHQQFTRVLIPVLGLLLLILLVTTALQVRLSIRPFTRMRNMLAEIKEGRSDMLQEKEFPREIRPLAEQINLLISYSRATLGRYRTFAENLSHSLKTPLSVLRNEAHKEKGKLADSIQQKSGAMLALIDRNLARARMAGVADVIYGRVHLVLVIEKTLQSFSKLHHKETSYNCPDGLYVTADESDIFEMLGNIIENACKYAGSKVSVSVEEGDGSVTITVEDDGRGIPEKERKQVLQRGIRVDETVSGTGIGLSIVQDIVTLYHGQLSLSSSVLGGLKVEITLPV